MTQFFLKDDGTIERDTPAELAVTPELEPQIVRFEYDGVQRVAQVITVRATGTAWSPNLLVAYELYNSRDGLQEKGVIKSYTFSKIIYLENA